VHLSSWPDAIFKSPERLLRQSGFFANTCAFLNSLVFLNSSCQDTTPKNAKKNEQNNHTQKGGKQVNKSLSPNNIFFGPPIALGFWTPYAKQQLNMQ
jgi:hypothetical protein